MTAFHSVCQTCSEEKCLILCDCQGPESEPLWLCLDNDDCPCNSCESILVLFNVRPESGIEHKALIGNARGVFYSNDPPDILTKGIRCILNGELWYPRQVMAKWIQDNNQPDGLDRSPGSGITPREKQILKMIASGATNAEIEKAMVISLHTVKSHLYNIYRKIHVSNRTQAARWTEKNLNSG